MRLLLTGANGQVGWELARALVPLGEVVALGRAQCDLARPERLPDVVRDVNPDIIVNAAAYTAVDKAEEEEELASTVNGTAAGVLAEEARRRGALFVHYSTDYVFDGKKNTPYTEDDAPCPINAYGRSKLAGERAVGEVGGNYIIFRTSWVYAARGHNFLRTILRLARERDELRIVADQIGAPTWARDIAKATAAIIEAGIRERSEKRFAPGIFHMTAAGAASWYDFAEAILEVARELDIACDQTLLRGKAAPELHPITSEDYPSPAPRPRNSRLAGDRLRGRFKISPPDWRNSLSCCLGEMAALEPQSVRF